MDLIQLPPPGEDGPPDDLYPATGVRRWLLGGSVAALLVLVLALVAVLNQHRALDQHRAAERAGSSTGPSQSPQPNQGTFPDPVVPAVACPQIRDEQSHLGYTCIDNYLKQDSIDTNLGLRIALNHEVEPGWVISEGSGDPTSIVQSPDTTVVGYRANHNTTGGGSQPSAADVRTEVQRRTMLALQRAYGDNPTARTLSAQQRQLSGVTGYELVTEITIDPDYRAAQGLQVQTERLWVVGLPTPSGVSIFMMSIPDERRDLWSKAEATVGTVHLI